MTSHSRRRPRRWRPSLTTWLAASCALTGIVLLSYTPAASWLSQYQQSRLIDTYNDSLRREGQATGNETGSAAAGEALADARAYNEKLRSGAILAPDTNVPRSAEETAGNEYHKLLNGPADIMARIRIPSIDVDLPVYHGTSDLTLLRGAGHLQGTSLPVGGESTHSVITAHRGLAEATMFTNLDRMHVGDTFTIEVMGEVLVYEVRQTQVVAPEEQEALYPKEGHDLLTLVTCTPLGVNTHRILVTGERVIPTPQEEVDRALQDSDLPRFPWWLFLSGGGVVTVIGYLWLAGRRDARLHQAAIAAGTEKMEEPAGSETTDTPGDEHPAAGHEETIVDNRENPTQDEDSTGGRDDGEPAGQADNLEG